MTEGAAMDKRTNQDLTTGYTRAQLAAAIDEAHGHLHAVDDALIGDRFTNAAHEALHRVGAGQPRTGCATPDPEAQRVVGAWIEKLEGTGLPCGHRLADLIGGPGAITKCGACVAARQKTDAAKFARTAATTCAGCGDTMPYVDAVWPGPKGEDPYHPGCIPSPAGQVQIPLTAMREETQHEPR